jgi:hypothetical protein
LRARRRYDDAKTAARAFAEKSLQSTIGVNFSILNWSRRAEELYRRQWPPLPRPNGGWDWPSIFQDQSSRIDRLDIVIIGPEERLCAIGIADTTGESVFARILEADSRSGCPLKGLRSLIYFETVAAYGQNLGKNEMRCQPINDKIGELYRDTYGFEIERPRKGQPYYRKGITA